MLDWNTCPSIRDQLRRPLRQSLRVSEGVDELDERFNVTFQRPSGTPALCRAESLERLERDSR